MSNITISQSMRQILNGLQNTATQMSTTQNRIATGKKVQSAIDDPISYFASQALYNRSADLSNLKSKIIQGMNVVKSATTGLSNIEKVLTQMKGLAEQALAAGTTAERTNYASQYDALRSQLDRIAADSSYSGVNLIKASPDSLKVNFNEDGTSSLTVTGVASDSSGLSVTGANDWSNATLATGATNISGDITLVNAALVKVRTTSATLGSNAALLNIRSEFTNSLINTLESGGDSLTNADLNEESAKALSLQTRQQLSMTSLSLASQAEQAVLKLF